MAVGKYYCRTISFPNLNPCSKSTNNVTPSNPYHVRSTSLPCDRTHPSIPQLKDQISHLSSWHRSKPVISRANATSSWLVNGLTQLTTVVESVSHALQIPLVHDSLGLRLVESLLEHFLRFLDVFGSFHTWLLSLKHEIAAAQVALRRKDDAKMIAYVKFHKKMVKEMSKLLSTVDRPVTIPINGGDDETTDEIPTILRDVLDLTTSVSASVLDSVLSSLGSSRRRAYSWAGLGLSKKYKRADQNDVVQGMEYQFEQLLYKKKGEEGRVLKIMQEMEDNIGSLEICSGRVLRSLINTRVSLLNILTHI